MPLAAFAVHQLRYLLAYGAGAGAELQRTGHDYLHSVVPWLVALAALAAGRGLWCAGRTLSGQRTVPRFAVSLVGLWLICSAALLAIFVGQEALEGFFATGHPAGLAGVFGYGGWWAIPVSLCIGLMVASLFHGAVWAVRAIAERWAKREASSPRRARLCIGRPDFIVCLTLAPIAGGWSDRGPPGLHVARL